MKSAKQIREEIKAAERTVQNYRNAYKEGTIPKNVFEHKLTDYYSTVEALTWVLGENDRFD